MSFEANDQVPTHDSNSNQIKISTAKSAFFYVDLASRFLSDNDEVYLSGLGFACTTVCTTSEILKSKGLAIVTKISTSMIEIGAGQKAKIEIIIKKGPNYAFPGDNKNVDIKNEAV